MVARGLGTCCALLTAASAGVAQDAPSAALEWSRPQIVASSSERLLDPVLAVDPEQRLHLAWPAKVTAEPVRYRIRLAHAEATPSTSVAWSTPVTVVEESVALAPSLAADPYGELHVLWFAAGQRLDHVSLTRAGRRIATPTATESNTHADLVADVDGTLHLTYPGKGAAGVFYRQSVDGGANWSDPVTVASPSAPDRAADYTRLAGAGSVVLDLVWTEFELPGAWPPVGVFHSRSMDAGRSWTRPVQLADGDAGQASIVRLDPRTVHVAWNRLKENGVREHRWSNDGATTWLPVDTVAPGGGAAAPPQLLVDGGGTLHLVTTYRDAVWHRRWLGTGWGDSTYVAGADAHAPALSAVAAIQGGDRLVVVYRDPQQRLLSAEARTGAPASPPIPPRRAEWWSPRGRRDLPAYVPVWLAMAISVAGVRVVRLHRARRRHLAD